MLRPTPSARTTLPTIPSLHPTLSASTVVTASADTPDGSHWYSFDEFDDVGGSSSYAQHRGLFRSKGGAVLHYELTGTIRVLKTAPDGSLYIGAGCGVKRFAGEQWQTLAETDCDHSHFSKLIFPFDIAFAPDGDVWVGGVYALAHLDHTTHTWTEYDIPARRLMVAPDDSVWADGWDGVADSDCCYSHLTGSSWVTYPHTAKLPIPDVLIRKVQRLVLQL